jgi:superfamily II DNA/RNA helicase
VAEPLTNALAARGITAPFPIQIQTLPDTIAGKDVLGRGKTGSGKTLAFSIPLVSRLAGHRRRPSRPSGLVLAPTRELATQITAVLEPLAAAYDLRVTTIFGGVPQGRQVSALKSGVDIVVACPGRLEDLMKQRVISLDAVEITVIDEADHMADLGFLPAVTQLLDQTQAGGQRMFFSATLDRGVGQLVTKYVTDPALHAVPQATESAQTEHSVLVLSAEDKVPVAAEIASRPGRTLFFVRTKHGADRLAKQLSRAGVGAAAIHGNRNQNQRQRALDAFAAGHPRVLVATDVAARGIHVDDVDLIVQFDPPDDHKDYLHRSGRTARAGAFGQVVALVERGQVRDLQRMHTAAGITAARHDAAPGHHAVREFATSGTPITPAPARTPRTSTQGAGTSRVSTAKDGVPTGRTPSPRRRPRRPVRYG